MVATTPCGRAALARPSGSGPRRSPSPCTWDWCALASATRRRAGCQRSSGGRCAARSPAERRARPSRRRATRDGRRSTVPMGRSPRQARSLRSRAGDRGSWTPTRAACVSWSTGPTPAHPSCARCRRSRAPATCCKGASRATTARTPDLPAAGAIDGTYARRWAGAPGKTRWTLRVDLDRAAAHRSRASGPRVRRDDHRRDAGGGRSYAIAWAPIHYTMEASEDGRHFVAVASEPLRADGIDLPLRRRLVTLPDPRPVRALRLIIDGRHGLRPACPNPGPSPSFARCPRTEPTTTARSSPRRGS